MKRNLLLGATLLLAAAGGAQELSKLTAPASPAFSILNFEPAAVMRPASAKSLAADILNSVDADGKLLPNLGLEVTPYWMKSNPKLTRETYLRPNVGQTIRQTLSLSAATVRDSVTDANGFGGGFRFRLLNGEPVPELEEASKQLKSRVTVVSIVDGFQSMAGQPGLDTRDKVIAKIADAMQRSGADAKSVAALTKAANTLKTGFTDSAADIRRFLEQLRNNRVEAYADLAQTASNLLYQRRGFILELAGAAGYAQRRTTDLDKLGFWANASYGASADDLLTLTARYMFRNTDSSLNNLDAGLGYLKKTAKYNLSAEALVRHYRAEVPDVNGAGQPIRRVEKELTWRVAFQGSYLIARDISINLSFGKDFATPFVSGSAFFSVFGLNFSVFNRKPAELAEE